MPVPASLALSLSNSHHADYGLGSPSPSPPSDRPFFDTDMLHPAHRMHPSLLYSLPPSPMSFEAQQHGFDYAHPLSLLPPTPDEAPQGGAGGGKRYRSAPPKTFQCAGHGECRMVFSRSEHLARHIRKHTGERPFACHCAKQFSRLDNLRQHAQTVHSAPEDKPRNEAMMRALASINASMMAGVRGASRRRFSPASAPSYSPGSSASPLPSPGLASSYPHPSHYPPHAYAQQQHGYVSPPGSGYAEYAPNGAQSGEQGYFGYTASPLGSPCAASFPPAAGPPPYNVDLEQLEGLERICGEESHQQREVQVEQERVRVKEEVREDEGLGLAGFYAALHAHPQEAPLSRYASSGSLRSEHSAHAHAQQQQHPAYAFAPHPHPHPASNAHNAHPPASAPNVYPGSSGGSAHSSPAASPSAANFWGGEAPPRPQLAGYPTVTGNEGSGRGKGSPRPGTDPNPSAGNFWGGEAPPVVQRQQQQQEYPHHAHAQGQGQGTEYLPSPPQSPAYSAHSGSSGSGSGSGSQSSGYGGEGAYTWAGAGAGAEEGMGVGEGEMSNAEYYAALQAEGYYAAAGQQGQQQQQHVY